MDPTPAPATTSALTVSAGPATAAGGVASDNGLRTLTHLMYALHTLSWFSLGLLSVVAMIINLAKRGSLPDRFYASHFSWQARSFWFTLLWLVLTAPLWLLFVFPGYAAWFVVGLWYLYRFIRGWWAFAENRPMPMPAAS